MGPRCAHDRLSLGAGVIHQSDSFTSISNAVLLPAYTRVDAAAYVSLTRNLELQVNVDNLFTSIISRRLTATTTSPPAHRARRA